MRKNLIISVLTICIAVFCISLAGQQAVAADSCDLYYFNDAGSLDLHSMQPVSSIDAGADIRYGTTGSKWYFIGLNGASINDLGAVDFNGAKLPDSGYTIDRTDVAEGHVYAVKCGDGSYWMIKVTAYDSEGGSTEFMVRTAEPGIKLNLYYLNADYPHFDFETLQNVTGLSGGDLYFRQYDKTAFTVENGAVIKDLGVIDYESAKAPLSGYKSTENTALKDHVYAIKTSSKNAYVMKITNVVSGSEIEFMARKAEIESSDTGNVIDSEAVSIKGTVYLDWKIENPGDIDGYYIYRASASGGYTEPLTDFPVLKREFTDDTVEAGMSYYYIVRAVLPGNKQSDPSNEVMVTVKKDDSKNNPEQIKTVIVLKVGDPMMTVNGISKEIDPGKGTAPVIIGTRAFLPIRAVIDELKGTVDWNGSENKLTVKLKDKKVELWIGEKTIRVNGTDEEMDVSPQNINGRTMLPVRFVAKNLGCDMDWDGLNQKITITYSGASNNPTPDPTPPDKVVDTKGEIQGGKYIYNGKVIFEINGTLDWACISPNEKYVAYKDGQYIKYYDISSKKHIDLYKLTTDEYMGKYVYNYGFTSPTNYDFVRWADDSSYIVVDQWTNEVFKGGSGYQKITISDKKMTPLNE